MAVDESVGYPRSYAKLCRDRGAAGTYSHGPPFTFLPCALQQHEVKIQKLTFSELCLVYQKTEERKKERKRGNWVWGFCLFCCVGPEESAQVGKIVVRNAGSGDYSFGKCYKLNFTDTSYSDDGFLL